MISAVWSRATRAVAGCFLSMQVFDKGVSSWFFVSTFHWALFRMAAHKTLHLRIDFSAGRFLCCWALVLPIIFLCLFSPNRTQLLDELVTALAQVDLVVTSSKTKILTAKIQQSSWLQLHDGTRIQVLWRENDQKWLSCILSAHRVGGQQLRSSLPFAGCISGFIFSLLNTQ